MANKTLKLLLQHPELHFNRQGGTSADAPIVLKDHYFMYHIIEGHFLELPEGESDSKYEVILDRYMENGQLTGDTLTVTLETEREDYTIANLTCTGLQQGGFLTQNNPLTTDNTMVLDVNTFGQGGDTDSFMFAFTITNGNDTKYFILDPTVKLRTDPNTKGHDGRQHNNG